MPAGLVAKAPATCSQKQKELEDFDIAYAVSRARARRSCARRGGTVSGDAASEETGSALGFEPRCCSALLLASASTRQRTASPGDGPGRRPTEYGRCVARSR
jgi:hypothetical protein